MNLNKRNINNTANTYIINTVKTKKSLISIALTSALMIVSNLSFAEAESAEELERISVTATRSSLSIDDALASQVIISRRDIEMTQAKSLTDLLATVAGIDVANNGGRGQLSSIFMRGTNSDHTLILVDGVRVSSATSGLTSLNTIAPELIERIEIVQGPRAALWGSDAIGGVIQIFTRKLNGGEYFAGATFGSDNFQQYKAGFGISHGDGQTSISVSHEKSDGYDVYKDNETDDDGYKFTSVAVKGEQKISNALSVDWLFSNDQGDNEYDGYYNGSDMNNHAWLLRGTYQAKIADIENTSVFSVGQNRDHADSLSNGASQSVFETRRDQYSFVNHSKINAYLQVNMGVDYYEEEVSGAAYTDDSRSLTGLFVHGLYDVNALTFEATIRHDDVEDTDSEITYNLGTGYKINQDSRLILNYGTGFKAPTFNDLYYPWGGNPELTSELSETVELVAQTSISLVDIHFSVYHSNVDDLIIWSNNMNENVDEVEINGAEITAKYFALGGDHEFNASYTDSEDQATNQQLIRRAKNKFNYKFNTSVGHADIYAEYQFHGNSYDSVWGVGRIKLDNYQLINLGVSYTLTKNIDLQTRVTNLLDEEYETVYNYQTQERAFYLGITYSQF